MTRWLTVLSAWLALCCLACSGPGARVAGAGQVFVVSGSTVPVDLPQLSHAVQPVEAEQPSHRAGAEPTLGQRCFGLTRGLSCAEPAWHEVLLDSPRLRSLLGLAQARAPPSSCV